MLLLNFFRIFCREPLEAVPLGCACIAKISFFLPALKSSG